MLAANPKEVKAYRRGRRPDHPFRRRAQVREPHARREGPPNKRIRRGAVIRVQKDDKGAWQIVQMPEVESAFVSIDPQTGSIRALVGGFDFNKNKFNHVSQAWRQPGPASSRSSTRRRWRRIHSDHDSPRRTDRLPGLGHRFAGVGTEELRRQIRGTDALAHGTGRSKNMVSIRVLQSIGTHYAQDYATRFGFEAEKHPAYLTMALGAGSVTRRQMVTAYATFANGGYRIQPYVVRDIRDDKDQILAQAQPTPAGIEELRIIDPRNAFVMDSLLRDVTIYGTAAGPLPRSSARTWPARQGRPTNTSMPGSVAISRP